MTYDLCGKGVIHVYPGHKSDRVQVKPHPMACWCGYEGHPDAQDRYQT